SPTVQQWTVPVCGTCIEHADIRNSPFTIHTKQHVQLALRLCSIGRWIGDSRKKGRIREDRIILFTQCGGLIP
ncbi:unnamed protein product, partial [Staurois parvus]